MSSRGIVVSAAVMSCVRGAATRPGTGVAVGVRVGVGVKLGVGVGLAAAVRVGVGLDAGVTVGPKRELHFGPIGAAPQPD
jgi:hypothetical protein